MRVIIDIIAISISILSDINLYGFLIIFKLNVIICYLVPILFELENDIFIVYIKHFSNKIYNGKER